MELKSSGFFSFKQVAADNRRSCSLQFFHFTYNVIRKRIIPGQLQLPEILKLNSLLLINPQTPPPTY